jgi:hypothetical protein
MRAFEFYAKKVFENVAVENTPKSIEGAIALNAALDKAIEVAKQKQNSTKSTTIKPTPLPSQQNQRLAASQINTQKPVESLDEAKQDYKSLIAEAQKDLKALEKLLPPASPESAKVLANFKQKIIELEKLHNEELKSTADETKKQVLKDIKTAKKELATKIKQLVAKAEGLEPDSNFEKTVFDKVQKGIEDMLKSQVDALEEDDTEDAQSINAMLDQGIAGNIIQMSRLVTTKQGNIFDYINSDLDPKVRETFDKIKRDIMKFVPPSKGSGNYGPAEVFLAMFGNPAKKAGTAGDLIVGKEKFELKGSGFKTYDEEKKSGTGLYGARLGAKAVNSADVAWEDFNNELMKIDPSLQKTNTSQESTINPKTKKPTWAQNKATPGYLNWLSPTFNKDTGKTEFKKASRFNFNKSGVDLLNNEILGPKSDKAKTTNLLKAILPKLIKGVQKIEGYEEKVESIVADDGTIDFDQFNRVYGGLAYSSYQSGQDKIGKIMLINGHSGNYVIVNGPQELQARIADKTIKVAGGMTWNDDQQKATAQFAVQ